jgi:hypothetical protein
MLVTATIISGFVSMILLMVWAISAISQKSIKYVPINRYDYDPVGISFISKRNKKNAQKSAARIKPWAILSTLISIILLIINNI